MEQNSTTYVETKFCKECGSKIARNAVVCPCCGSQIDFLRSAPNNYYSGAHDCPPGLKKKNKWVAFFICLYLGLFGIHKFYEGKILEGLVFACTLGLFFVGWICNLFSYLGKSTYYYVG